jgi:hypothetical protein
MSRYGREIATRLGTFPQQSEVHCSPTARALHSEASGTG